MLKKIDLYFLYVYPILISILYIPNITEMERLKYVEQFFF